MLPLILFSLQPDPRSAIPFYILLPLHSIRSALVTLRTSLRHRRGRMQRSIVTISDRVSHSQSQVADLQNFSFNYSRFCHLQNPIGMSSNGTNVNYHPCQMGWSAMSYRDHGPKYHVMRDFIICNIQPLLSIRQSDTLKCLTSRSSGTSFGCVKRLQWGRVRINLTNCH